jgi:hypothetical protein
MRVGLRTHPKVVRITSALNADNCPQDVRIVSDRFRVIGALHAVWSLADEHTEDGSLPGYSLSALDDSIGWPGFAQAMKDVEWLEVTPQGLVLPRFDEHNGASAKRRAQESERKRRDRKTSAPDADKKRTRERERERSKPPVVPLAGFDLFWAAWPKSERKGGKGECLARWQKLELEPQVSTIVAHVERMKTSRAWTDEAGKFIPAPLPYLNGKSWDGAEVSAPARPPELRVAL